MNHSLKFCLKVFMTHNHLYSEAYTFDFSHKNGLKSYFILLGLSFFICKMRGLDKVVFGKISQGGMLSARACCQSASTRQQLLPSVTLPGQLSVEE